MPGIDSYTKLMLHCDGADTSTTFTDSSASGHTVTANGNAQIDTAQNKFGGASGLFDGSGDYLTVPDHADFAFGSGDFTLDFWVRFNALPTAGNFSNFYSRDVSTHDLQLDLQNSAGTYNLRFIPYISGAVVISRTWSTPAINTWYHIAFVRNGTNWHIFVDGTQLGSTGSQSGTLDSSTDTISIGRHTSGTPRELNGWLDEFRVSKGVARWTSNFTPPAAPYDSEIPFIGLIDNSAVVFTKPFIIPAETVLPLLNERYYHGTLSFSVTPASTYSATFAYTGTLSFSLTPVSDYDGKFNFTGTVSITLTAPDTGVVTFTTDLPYLVFASVFIDDVYFSGNIVDSVNVTRQDNAAATFNITIKSSDKAAGFINQVVKIAFQAADSTGEVADFIPIFRGLIKRVSLNESEPDIYQLSGYDYGGVHQISGERISENITEVFDGSIYIDSSGTFATGKAPIWSVTYTGTDDIVDGRDFFVNTLNGQIIIPISSNFRNFPGVLTFKYANPFSSLKAMLENIASRKSWNLVEDGVSIADYSTPAKQPVLTISDESVIDVLRKFFELSGAKCETNLFPDMRIYSEVVNITGADLHTVDESIYFEDSLSFDISFEELLNEQTVRSVGKTFANIEISGSEQIANESGSVTTELLYDVLGYVDVVIPALQKKTLAEIRISKANINSVSHTAGGTFIHLFGSPTAISNSDWEQTEEGNEIVYRLKVLPKVDVFTVRTIVSYSGASWTLTVNGTKIEYGEGTIEQTVEVTSTRAVTGITETLAGDVYENPYIETAAHAEACANAILTEFGNVYEMSCEVPLFRAKSYNIGDKINVERSSSVIFRGIIKSLSYSLNLETGQGSVAVSAKGVGFTI